MHKDPQQCSISDFKGVGKELEKKLVKAGFSNGWDLLLSLPYKYQDRTRLTPLSELQEGQEVLVRGVVQHVDVSGFRQKSLTVYLAEGQFVLALRFFRFYPGQLKQFEVGKSFQCFGVVKRHGFQWEMAHPVSSAYDPVLPPVLDSFLTPVYSTHKGIADALFRRLVEQALTIMPVKDYLPDAFRKAHQLAPIYDLLRAVHEVPRGTSSASIQSCLEKLRYRLCFEELLAHQLSLSILREQYQALPAKAYAADVLLKQTFLSALPYQLTAAQTRVLTDIENDLAKEQAMLRLVQGDVGSGKTVVAALAALPVLSAGGQVAMMAPTEILAEQHFAQFKIWFEALGFRVAFLASKLTAKEKRECLSAIAAGEVDMIVGTHALFQKDVVFASLGFAIIDEQHRFGVHQRMMLRDKGAVSGSVPHQLIMTATPIPRTLAMCAYADLDQSIIDELPPGRKPIKTVAIDNQRRDEVIARIQSVCAEGRQVYWVCTLIEESEKLNCEAAEKTLVTLQAALTDLRIALVHGQMKADEKAKTMAAFVAGELDVLVATTVIEVGVNVPNASLMVIDNAERLGLSQLHQLRGRIGRGEYDSFCVLVYQSPLGKIAKLRLNALRETQDGFKIAEIDLKLRGPGELLGTQQAGDVNFRFADIERDASLLESLEDVVDSLDPATAELLIKRWRSNAADYRFV